MRLVVDRCEAATVAEIDNDLTSSVEDRRACEAVGKTPGDGRLLTVNGPLQLGGRSNPRSKYPNNILKDGFNGCIKNFMHNGQVRLHSNWLEWRVYCLKTCTLSRAKSNSPLSSKRSCNATYLSDLLIVFVQISAVRSSRR